MEKISCLMVTKDSNRFDFFKKSYKSFEIQTYNNKELIIISGEKEYYNKLKKYIKNKNVKLYFSNEKKLNLKLGDLRNLSVEKSSGDILVNWDDDDISHPERLQIQYNFLIENKLDACFFEDQFHYFYDSNELFWVKWLNDYIPGTLMCLRKCHEKYKHPSCSLSEDHELKLNLLNDFKIDSLKEKGYLYLYTYTGYNVFDRNHHYNIIVNGKDLSLMKSLKNKTKIIKYNTFYKREFEI